MTSLASVFEDGEPEAVEQVDPEVVEDIKEEEISETQEEPEKVEEKEPEATTAPESQEAEHQSVPIKALMAEREKRQALERQVADFNAQKASEPAPDIFEDQEAYTTHLKADFDNARFNDKANMSEFLARREYSDLDSKVEKFKELKVDNPALESQVLNAVSPYHEIVDIVSKHEELEKMQNIGDYKAAMRAEIEAEVRAEMEAKSKSNKSLRDSIPTSLVDEKSKGTVARPSWDGPSTLGSILD